MILFGGIHTCGVNGEKGKIQKVHISEYPYNSKYFFFLKTKKI